MTKRESKPVVYEGIEYASLRELADLRFDGNYNRAFQTVYRYNRRRNRAVVWTNLRGERMEFVSLAALGRYLGVSRERARQIVNETAENGEKES